MAYKVNFEKTHDIVKIEVTGKRHPKTVVADGSNAWAEIINYIKKEQSEKVLVVSKLEGPLNLVKSLNVVDSFKHLGLPSDIKVAYVETNKDAWSSNSFAASKAYQNGYFIKIFREEVMALNWLGNII